MPRQVSNLQQEFRFQLTASRNLDWVAEYRFHPARRWRFDFAWPEKRVALEIEGGTWTHGAHVRGKRYEQDCEKYNAAALRGWRVFRATSNMVKDGRALQTIEGALHGD